MMSPNIWRVNNNTPWWLCLCPFRRWWRLVAYLDKSVSQCLMWEGIRAVFLRLSSAACWEVGASYNCRWRHLPRNDVPFNWQLQEWGWCTGKAMVLCCLHGCYQEIYRGWCIDGSKELPSAMLRAWHIVSLFHPSKRQSKSYASCLSLLLCLSLNILSWHKDSTTLPQILCFLLIY